MVLAMQKHKVLILLVLANLTCLIFLWGRTSSIPIEIYKDRSFYLFKLNDIIYTAYHSIEGNDYIDINEEMSDKELDIAVLNNLPFNSKYVKTIKVKKIEYGNTFLELNSSTEIKKGMSGAPYIKNKVLKGVLVGYSTESDKVAIVSQIKQ